MNIEIRNRTSQKLEIELSKLKEWITENFKEKKFKRIMVIIE